MPQDLTAPGFRPCFPPVAETNPDSTCAISTIYWSKRFARIFLAGHRACSRVKASNKNSRGTIHGGRGRGGGWIIWLDFGGLPATERDVETRSPNQGKDAPPDKHTVEPGGRRRFLDLRASCR